MSYNIIGDIAGNYKTLMALIQKMPKGKIVSVGDIVDRGPRSPEVVEYFMKTPDTHVLMGNHEHLLVDYFRNIRSHSFSHLRQYAGNVWLRNGGLNTLRQYDNNVPEDVLKFLESRPLDLTLDIGGKTFYISHAFKGLPGDHSFDYNDDSPEILKRVWNRNEPFFNDESADVQICGHNSQFGLRYWTGINGKRAVSIDTSRNDILTGIHLPSMTIYQQEYID